ncbi:DUF4192 domain-containing protein [Nocardia sp. NPDC050378]|uniref:DUF4192 domain-containing protein n=1 Tax=Nocardia sp. NPDC050378 TaxID=3155400 RepID=UPI003407AD19
MGTDPPPDDAVTGVEDIGRDPVGVRVDSAGSLIAALPALLGFVPHRSLVAALVSNENSPGGEVQRMIRAVVRFDIDAITESASVQESVELLKSVHQSEDITSTMIVVVDDRSTATETAQHAVRLLRAAAIDLTHAWLVPSITAEARYRDLLNMTRRGAVPDPRTSPVTFAQVLHGTQIYGSREELAGLISPDSDLADHVGARLSAAAEFYRQCLDDAVRTDDVLAHRRTLVNWVLTQIDRSTESILAAADLASLVVVLRDVFVRDIAFGLAATPYAAAAERLWVRVARASRGSDRANTAVLCGYSAYYRGDTVTAAIFLDAALNADASHPMAVLLDTAVRNGIPPDRIRELAVLGCEIATELGLDTKLS